MSIKFIINRIEISIWEKLIILMSESALVQNLLPKIYKVVRNLPVGSTFLYLLFWGAMGLSAGFVLSGIKVLLW